MSSTRTTLPLVHSGKIRELYALPDDQLLLLATDNVSAYDHVLPTPIPGKGAVLTQLTTWWLTQLGDVMPNHLVGTDVPPDVSGRALVVEKLEMIPVECVVRGYLAGSAWTQYSQSGSVAGLTVPEGLQRGERLERPIFTPAVKAPQGSHDENITFAQLVDMVGEQTALELRRASLRLYVRAERVAREHGLVLVDTKFEFGRRVDGTLVLADEVLTPDSSRYWAADSYAPGTEMPSLDKQQLRDWITNDSGWNPDSGELAPQLPDEVVSKLSQTYADTYERLTGAQVVPSAPLDTSAEAEPTPEPSVEDVQPVGETPAEDVQPAAETPAEEQWTFIVDVMLREDIPDAQGAAITETLKQLGHEGFTVRQGKRFEVVLDGELTQERVDEVRKVAEELLVNTEVEDFEVSLVHDDLDDDYEFDDDHDHHDHDHHDHDHHDHDHGDHEHEPYAEQAEDAQPAEAGDAESTGGQSE
ncbi:MAG TPA: phosphoribosylaminoimidazolesuccinocarboxamide synthase [Propionibacteriaceae bacterium]